MSHELTNLLPKEKTRAFRREYFMRLGTVAVVLAICVVVAHGLLLFPSYLFLSGEVASHTSELSALTASLGAQDEQQVSARIASLAEDTEQLARLETVPSASAAFRAMLAVPRSGILLTGISFSPPKQKDDGRMMISGSATTRTALQSFKEELASLPFVTSADLPISSFAKESDIPFSITVTGSLKP